MSTRWIAPVGALVATVGLAGCTSSDDVPATEGLPDGTYRVTVSQDAVRDAGYGNGPGWSGTWTLVLDEGTFTLACTPVDQPGVDCGNHPDPASVEAVEAGTVEVSGETITFTTVAADLAELTGCDQSAGDCGGDAQAELTWSEEDGAVTFAAVGALENLLFVIKPWQKIS
jgi:hypothetical protein